ncbi:MAG: Carbon-monoxide dehydrogenase medium subunit [Pseudonocardia sp.]|nr:Carbon-monoxide dehydrogenase medium subunit [Pseudonocardia sp.]
MKPAPFRYHRPATVDEAVEVLAAVGPDGKVLAGGQSLVPMLNMRLAAPANLVDINRVAGLDYVAADGSGVRVGATARHTDVERDTAAFEAVPLLRRALQSVAHPTIRNRGTTVGSLAHADPAGELTAVLAVLGGTVQIASTQGERSVTADEFFVGPLESCLADGELAVSAFFPRPPGRTGSAWLEVARRHGDYAMCGVGALVTLDDDAGVVEARAGYISVGSTPVVLDLTDPVRGSAADSADWAAAGRLAQGGVEPEADIHATAEYRRHLVGVLTARALRAAAADAAAQNAEDRG